MNDTTHIANSLQPISTSSEKAPSSASSNTAASVPVAPCAQPFKAESYRSETKPSMKRRAYKHDYCAPSVYMLTLAVEGRKPLLGKLIANVDEPYVEWSAVGKMVAEEIELLPTRCPSLKILQKVIMPDHVHLILQAKERLPQHLGIYVRGLKQGCTKRYREYLREETLKNEAPHKTNTTGPEPVSPCASPTVTGPEPVAPCASPTVTSSVPVASCAQPLRAELTSLFEPGLNDKIIWHPSQLPVKIAYIKDNPRRLALKRRNRSFFTIHRQEPIGGRLLDWLGNKALLQKPLMAVHVRSRWNEEEKRQYKNACILAARKGTVLISPFISPDERAVRDIAMQEGLPLVLIRDNGFSELWKPEKMFFDACSEGRILFLAPYPYRQVEQLQVTRQQCVEMNTLAEHLAELSNK